MILFQCCAVGYTLYRVIEIYSQSELRSRMVQVKEIRVGLSNVYSWNKNGAWHEKHCGERYANIKFVQALKDVPNLVVHEVWRTVVTESSLSSVSKDNMHGYRCNDHGFTEILFAFQNHSYAITYIQKYIFIYTYI